MKLMESEAISAAEVSRNDSQARVTPLSKVAPILFYIFLTITALAVFIPLNPRMPSRGIDPSYAFAMNEAVARHLSFGKQIVFTYGPYASICTRIYDPATDCRMISGSILLALSYVTAMLYLARDRKRYLILLLLLFFATFPSGESLLLSYPLLLVVCVLRHISSDDPPRSKALGWRQVLAVIVMWSALGLLPVVKGSLLLPFAASVAIPPVLLICRARYRHAFLLLLTPIVAGLAFWLMAGQSLRNIPMFVRGTILLTSGYTEAMSTSWSVLPAVVGDGLVILYLVISGVILATVCRSPRLTVGSKSALMLLCAVFLLVAFKHGFVGAMGVSSAFASLAAYILIVGVLCMDRYLAWSLSIVMVITAATSIIRDPVLIKQVHERFGVGVASGGKTRKDILAFCVQRGIEAYSRTTYQSTWSTYSGAWKGLYARVVHRYELGNRFAAAKSSIRIDYAVPAVKGTMDVYEYDQSVLLASDNTWDPRPVIQSYSAYTAALARLDEQHLRGESAPDWILFNIETIDGRLPSLDDGVSWPAMLDNYTFNSYDGKFVLMHKNEVVHPNSIYENVSTQACKTGATCTLPERDGLLFADVDLEPTLAGRLLISFLNPPELRIVLGLANGKTRTFRVVSEMMKTDVLLSPLVSNTAEFASLMAGSNAPQHLQDDNRVRTISIAPTYGGSFYWSGTYELTLKRYVGK